MSKIQRLFFIFVPLVLALLVTIPVLNHEKERTHIVFFGLGKADSILIKNKSKTILIDAGYKRDRKELADKLNILGIRDIDYMILSHPDKDHIGGASYIVDNFDVKNIVQTSYIKGSKAEARLKNSLAIKDVNELVLDDNYDFELGDFKVNLILPKSEFKKSNDNSINVLIEDRDLNYFFAGDSEELLLGELIEMDLPKIDIYKVAHHGRKNPNSKRFIEKLQPEHSIITNSTDKSAVQDILKSNGSEVYFAYQDDIYFYTDGEIISTGSDSDAE